MTATAMQESSGARRIWPYRPMRLTKGVATAILFYPIAEAMERRDVRTKVRELRRFYAMAPAEQAALSRRRLAEMLAFAGAHVPYYRDLFPSAGFDPASVEKDPQHLEKLPLLTKDIIAEQGERLLSRALAEGRYHACKTGGSTGRKVTVFYDQESSDYSSAVTAYARGRIGATRLQPALHFAARFPGEVQQGRFSREAFKCLAMNRSNIFFDRLDAQGLDEMWETLRQRAPYLVHAHPSTIYALALFLRDEGIDAQGVFEVFESSGEVLDRRQRQVIAETFGCRVIDRYGLAEFGVIAYELGQQPGGALALLNSECWAENGDTTVDGGSGRLIVTGLRNRLMPLIRYDTGDLATVAEVDGAPALAGIVGRVHDVVALNGVPYLTHHLQDVLDHRVGGIRDFQIDLRTSPPTLRIVPEPGADTAHIAARIAHHWQDALAISFVRPDEMVRVGDRAKFRHVVSA